MTAKVLDGKAIAREIRVTIREDVARFVEQQGVTPCLSAVLVGDDPASQIYVRSKEQACAKAGIVSQPHRLPSTTTEEELLGLVEQLNADPSVHGILVQLPLPSQIDEQRVQDAVHPLKDVDAFHPENVGLLAQGRPRFLPCTPHGVQRILHHAQIPVAGKHVVVIGRSAIVGQPIAAMLAQRDSLYGPQYANGTVTLCHSRTSDLAAVAAQADILIAAIGKPRFVTVEMIKPAATIIDVGVNRLDDGSLAGDVDYEAAREIAGAITPVPGGVGPLTITMLLHNTLRAAGAQLT